MDENLFIRLVNDIEASDELKDEDKDLLITRRAEFHGLCPWVNVKAAIWYV